MRRRGAQQNSLGPKKKRVSIIDVIMAVSGGSQHDAATKLRRVAEKYHEVGTNCTHFKLSRGASKAAKRADLEWEGGQ